MRDSQHLYVQAVFVEQATYSDPPPDEPMPYDVTALRAAIGRADPSIQQCQKGSCTRYCRVGGKWKCCEDSCAF